MNCHRLQPRFHRTRACLALVLGLLASAPFAGAEPVKIFFDTDMMTDCDDAGALAVLHTLAQRGECEILATVTSVPDMNSVAAVAAINAYYGRPGLPLGMVKGAGVKESSKFTAQLAREFPQRLGEVSDAVQVYREVLEKQPDRSVRIVTVGYLTNLRALLDSPGGAALVERKVQRYFCMGGNFIGDPPKDDLKLGNVNFQRDAASTFAVIPRWPTDITFAGREVCSVPSGLAIGANLARTPAANPVRRAYEHYFGGTAKNRHVADLATVLFAVRGGRDCWGVSPPGRMVLRPDMTFDWRADSAGSHVYLQKLKPDGKPNDRYVESVLDELLTALPL